VSGSGGKRARAYATKGPAEDGPGRGQASMRIWAGLRIAQLAPILRAWPRGSRQDHWSRKSGRRKGADRPLPRIAIIRR
jgi:hypothetical protein